jgi:mono/diheme cytochrome c family protein
MSGRHGPGRRLLAAAALPVLAAALAPAGAVAAPAAQDGDAIYAYRCAFCHGDEGAGDGPVAPYLQPRPRDFTAALYKLRTTKNATMPTDEDLERTVRDGVHGTAMPAWSGILSDAEIAAVVETIKVFGGGVFEDENYAPEVVAVGNPPSVNEALLARGREIFAGQEAQCIKCHGENGRGNGESAPGMTDDAGLPILPADLTKAWRFKGGHELADIFTRFSTGMDGSPMPSYLDALPDDADRWALAAYVQSLGRELSTAKQVVAERMAGELPAGPDDPAWEAVPGVLLPLAGQVLYAPRWQNPSVDAVDVRAAFNDEAVAVRLVWNDRFHDTDDSGEPPPLPEETGTYVAPVTDYLTSLPAYADRIELQFPARLPEGAARPFFLYGDASNPVTLWRWEAADETARELSQAGFRAESEAQPDAGQELTAQGAFDDGQYRVVFVRPRDPADEDIAFPEGQPIPFALHAWDGSSGETSWLDEERGASHLMSISAWYDLVLPPETPSNVYLATFLAIALTGGAEWFLIRRLRRGRALEA